MALRIVHYNEPVLRKKGEKVSRFDDALRQLGKEMIATMHAAGGIGLAAQQIGKAVQLCVVDLREADADFTWKLDGVQLPLDLFMPMVIANPVITVAKGAPEDVFEEGCLSFPQIRGDVKRPEAISVKYKDEFGVEHSLVCDGLFARCIQHETDHLNGILFIDHMTKKTLSKIDDAIDALVTETRATSKKP